jgi:hypothetical protein
VPLPLQLPATEKILCKGQYEPGDVFGDGPVEDAAGIGDDGGGVDEFREEQPVHARARGVHPRRAVPGPGPRLAHGVGQEVPHQQHVRLGQPRGQRLLVAVQHPGAAGEPVEARQWVGVEDEDAGHTGNGHCEETVLKLGPVFMVRQGLTTVGSRNYIRQ